MLCFSAQYEDLIQLCYIASSDLIVSWFRSWGHRWLFKSNIGFKSMKPWFSDTEPKGTKKWTCYNSVHEQKSLSLAQWTLYSNWSKFQLTSWWPNWVSDQTSLHCIRIGTPSEERREIWQKRSCHMWPRYVWDVPSVGRIRLSAVKSVCQIKQWDKTRYPLSFPPPLVLMCVFGFHFSRGVRVKHLVT